MAVRFKLTIKRGQKAQDVVKSAGTAITGSDAIELNVDVTNMTKLELLQALECLEQQIHEHPFPQ